MIQNLPEYVSWAVQRPIPGWEYTPFYSDSEHIKVVWHSTQGLGDPSGWYAVSGGIPHFTILRDGTLLQHYSTYRSSRALKNLWGGVQTNLDGVIQIEIVGFAGEGFAREQRATMRRLTAWFTFHGVAARWIVGAPPTKAAYDTGGQGASKLSDDAWDDGRGHCGHINVPENDHWDPAFRHADFRAVENGWKDGINRRKRKRITARIQNLRSRVRALRLKREALRPQ